MQVKKLKNCEEIIITRGINFFLLFKIQHVLWENTMRNILERNVMSTKISFITLCFSILSITGCMNTTSYLENECQDGICTSEQEYREVCVETPDGYSICEDAPVTNNVNYTRTQADFRKYGERTPRDFRITQAGVGNNMSASIPPSIDDEVIDYETEVMMRDAQNGNVEGAANVPNQRNAAYIQATMMAQNQEAVQPAPEKEKNEDEADEENLTKDWLAEEGQSLKELLMTWSEESGWRLIWKTNRNYILNAGAMFRGNFADVSSALVRAFARARPAPVATFYKGNRVLVIETMEDENAYD